MSNGSPGQTRETNILNCVADLVGELMYYGRKEDEELPRGAIEEALRYGEITQEQMVKEFARELNKRVHGG